MKKKEIEAAPTEGVRVECPIPPAPVAPPSVEAIVTPIVDWNLASQFFALGYHAYLHDFARKNRDDLARWESSANNEFNAVMDAICSVFDQVERISVVSERMEFLSGTLTRGTIADQLREHRFAALTNLVEQQVRKIEAGDVPMREETEGQEGETSAERMVKKPLWCWFLVGMTSAILETGESGPVELADALAGGQMTSAGITGLTPVLQAPAPQNLRKYFEDWLGKAQRFGPKIAQLQRLKAQHSGGEFPDERLLRAFGCDDDLIAYLQLVFKNRPNALTDSEAAKALAKERTTIVKWRKGLPNELVAILLESKSRKGHGWRPTSPNV